MRMWRNGANRCNKLIKLRNKKHRRRPRVGNTVPIRQQSQKLLCEQVYIVKTETCNAYLVLRSRENTRVRRSLTLKCTTQSFKRQDKTIAVEED